MLKLERTSNYSPLRINTVSILSERHSNKFERPIDFTLAKENDSPSFHSSILDSRCLSLLSVCNVLIKYFSLEWFQLGLIAKFSGLLRLIVNERAMRTTSIRYNHRAPNFHLFFKRSAHLCHRTQRNEFVETNSRSQTKKTYTNL